MAEYKPQPSPGGLRSPRNRALEMGTAPAGFQGGIQYAPHAGVPVMPGMPLGVYQTQGPFVSEQGSPINTPTPMVVGAKK